MSYKIYTKTGDDGETGLFGGKRVAKSDLRVDAYGTLDELNAFMGLLADSIADAPATKAVLHEVQHRLFTIGAHVASDPDRSPATPDLRPDDVALLENQIDAMEAELPALRNFILPGGHATVSLCHVCRTVCRRAERLLVALHQESPLDPLVLHYLNRLSDYFFVLSRMLSRQLGAPEVIWNARTS
jgi:cob(I)alamin adenosyltransferase